MTVQKKLEKRINTIIQVTGEYPKEMEVTKEEYEQLNKELNVTETIKFRNVLLKVKE